MKSELFEAIKYDPATGSISYPAVEGFELDKERVYRTVKLFAPHCASLEMAVRLAVHEHISEYLGARSLMRSVSG